MVQQELLTDGLNNGCMLQPHLASPWNKMKTSDACPVAAGMELHLGSLWRKALDQLPQGREVEGNVTLYLALRTPLPCCGRAAAAPGVAAAQGAGPAGAGPGDRGQRDPEANPTYPIAAGLQLHLASLRRKAPDQLAQGPEIEGNVILHPTAKIGRDCKIGPNVSIGIECVIEDGARISNSVLLHRVKARPPLAFTTSAGKCKHTISFYQKREFLCAGEELCTRGRQHHRLGLLHRQVGPHRQQVGDRRGRAHQGAPHHPAKQCC